MDRILFESTTSTLLIRNPLSGFAPEEQRVEVRRDPILGDTSVLNPYLGSKAGFFGVNDRAFIARLAEESAKGCIFCGERLDEKTARYPDDLVPGGRLVRGESTLLPNLFALGAYHPLVVLSRAHFLELSGFTPTLLGDGFAAARDFLRSVHRCDAAVRCAALGANYLPPAGASLLHPHLQMLATPVPYTRHERLLHACRSHHERHGSSRLEDLVREEQRLGKRYAAQLGGWHWIAAYAPLGCNEVLAIHESERDFAALEDDDLQALAAGVSKVLGFYGGLGLLSFNYLLFSVRRSEPAEGFRLLLRIVSRQNLSPGYRNDDYFLQKLLDADVVVTPPEELARGLRAAF
jgi:galactose-1-phosphate uridylyltransferase